MSSAAIESAIREAGLKSLSPRALSQFETYLALILKWNSRLNLTAIREPEGIIRRHFVESIQCAQTLPEVATLLDFGSGAGLPGIPIAICRPEFHVTLGESQQKKAAFLREAVRSLGLNAEVFDGRIEEMPHERLFSVVTLRAVDKMTEASRSGLVRIASHGWIVIFATDATESAIKAVLPAIDWRQKLPIIGLDRGEILLGQRKD